ncbi:hypothetical protein ACFLU4_00130 [Chloroflexota bacterium]
MTMKESIAGDILAVAAGAVNWRKRLSRWSAWTLLVIVLINLFSGWGITRSGIIYQASLGLVDRGLANQIHRLSQLPMVIIFLIHVLANVSAIFSRRWQRTWPVDALLAVMGLGIVGLALYLEYFA